MTRIDRGRVGTALLGLCLSLSAGADEPANANPAKEGTKMQYRAKGSFEVKVTPATIDPQETIASARLTADKEYRGDLVGTARGEMWTVDTGVEGSGGYVAIERVDGSLDGRRGRFVLLHQGTMRRGGDFRMRLVVVPDSGTDELVGLSGTVTILLVDGRHDYEMEYELPELRPTP